MVKIAPTGLVLVQEILNTRPAGKPALPDLLRDADAAQGWATGAAEAWGERTGLPVPDLTITVEELHALQVLRAQLQRAVCGEVRDEPIDGRMRDVRCSLEFRLGSDGELSAVPRGRGAAWINAVALREVFLGQDRDTWKRLKLCRNRVCSIAFYDTTNNNNGAWHNAQICGNAVNLRASRARRRRSDRTASP
ncbi:CGNR zinc finger domain-containing protein [Saccharopolyspora sp. 5N708]|uniref:CGNR zinc finger domain-containing protein n=1 Tax=Saccharopolyspora sp. 5N708 TaxID=3457424 RepID=UPI003FD2D961